MLTLLGAGQPANGGVGLLTGLLAAWRFDGSGADSSGNGNHLSGVGTYAGGLLGQALATGGMSSPAFTADNWSLCVWIQTGTGQDGAGGAVAAADQLLAVFGVNDATGGLVYGPVSLLGPFVLPASAWVHLALSVTGTTATMYVDGVSAGSCTDPSLALAAGSLSFNPSDNDFPTPMDMALLHSRALSAAEIAALYNGGAGFDPTA